MTRQRLARPGARPDARPGARPAIAASYDEPFGAAPAMLDGMDVLFDRTVGLYPVELDGGPAREVTSDGPAA